MVVPRRESGLGARPFEWKDGARAPRAVFPSVLAKRPETHAKFLREELRLLEGREVAALGELVVVDEVGVRLLRPAARRRIELVREDAHGRREGDAFDVEVPSAP